MEKKISEVYEDAQKNKVKGSNKVTMDFDEFVEEHLELIKVLTRGSREELIHEAEEQKEELCKYAKEYGYSYEDLEEEFAGRE
jgi:translation initiation factor 2B subunit (eIF-2B alpha/beta/delta family)